MNIQNEIIKLLNILGVEYKIEAGIVTTSTPKGECWNFTLPLPVDSDGTVLGTDKPCVVGQKRQWLATGRFFEIENHDPTSDTWRCVNQTGQPPLDVRCGGNAIVMASRVLE